MRRILTNLEEIITAFFLVILVMVLVANVFMRVTYSISLLWMEEIAFLCFSWVVFVGAAPAYKRNLHSGIDMVIKMFPEGVRQIVAVLGMVITLICCIIMVYLSYIFSIEAWEKYTPVLYIRYTFIDLSVTVGFFFTCVHCVRFIINMLRYGDYAKQIPIYPDIYDLDVLVSGAGDTEFHAESQRLRELAARKNGGVDEFNRRNTEDN